MAGKKNQTIADKCWKRSNDNLRTIKKDFVSDTGFTVLITLAVCNSDSLFLLNKYNSVFNILGSTALTVHSGISSSQVQHLADFRFSNSWLGSVPLHAFATCNSSTVNTWNQQWKPCANAPLQSLCYTEYLWLYFWIAWVHPGKGWLTCSGLVFSTSRTAVYCGGFSLSVFSWKDGLWPFHLLCFII